MALEETLLVEQFKNTQLQLELEKFKTSTTLNDDRQSESDATEIVPARAEPSVEAGIHELTNRPYGSCSKHEFKNLKLKQKQQEIAMPNIPSSAPSKSMQEEIQENLERSNG